MFSRLSEQYCNARISNLFYGKVARMLIWAGSQAASETITVSGMPNCLNYRVIFIVHIKLCGR
jgi:hypothetical protein